MSKKNLIATILIIALVFAVFTTTSVFLFLKGNSGDRSGVKLAILLLSLGFLSIAYSLIAFWIKKKKDPSYKKNAKQKQAFVIGCVFIAVAVIFNLVSLIWLLLT